jgi:hypothetical protein
MLYLPRQRLETVEHIREALLNAMRLELSTLPPYLTALYSIKPEMNQHIAKILRHVAVQEMLHFCLVGNILNAIGGRCEIATPKFVPHYPGPLPMNIGEQPGKPLIVPIERLSLKLIRRVFMTIEEPEDPLRYEDERTRTAAGRRLHTIGEFYTAIGKAIAARGKSIFTGDPKLQVTGELAKGQLFAVTGPAAAGRAIEIIKEQGEGTSIEPTDLESGLAHYYIFAEVANGRRLVRSSKAPGGWSFTGPSIPFDPNGVYPMVDDPGEVELPQDCPIGMVADRFDDTFSVLINALHLTFNGEPRHLERSIGVMYTLRIISQQLMQMAIPGRKVTAGPRWRYVATATVA